MIFLDALRDLMQSGTYAWGVAALVHMYDNLNEASKSMTRQLAGSLYYRLVHMLIKHFFIGGGYYMLSLIFMNMFAKYL